MAVIDVSRQRRSLLQDATALDHLPAELLEIIKDHASPKFLDAVSEAALSPPLTERFFVHFEDIFPDICARWIRSATHDLRRIEVASALARLLPFSSHLSTFLQNPDNDAGSSHPPSLRLTLSKLEDFPSHLEEKYLLQSLITAWRLLSFDAQSFGPLFSPAFMQSLFVHQNRAVRYVAIRVFCQLLHASDHKLDLLVNEHVGQEDAIISELDGRPVDFGFLSLHEQARAKRVITMREQAQRYNDNPELQPSIHTLTPYVVPYGGVVLPRPFGPTGDPPSLVMTSTTIANLENLASLLRNPDPILLHGLPGVGKTALVHEIGKQLGMYSNMVTLHLNEQTDAKMLIGLYSTDSKPGSFQWRPGVLTTAVKEGRWVLVEDLDRAPTEVLSTLLPLIERKELLIPSRGERIRAANSFRLFATVRTSRGLNGRENLPSLVGMRFWQSLYTEPPKHAELEEIILQSYPLLRKFVPGILAVYDRLSRVTNSTGLLPRGRSAMDRQLNLRDLLKWCRRLRECLSTAGSTTGEEPISETTRDWMFMEAVDCFVGSCPDEAMSKQIMYAIAEEMHLSKERADHYLIANIPPLEENDSRYSIGRAHLRKKKLANRPRVSKRTFASTTHSKRLLEQIAVAVKLNEPVLLVGETGIGKTTVVQQLAESLGHKLTAVNLSQQSEVGDLLGGFKPVNVRSLAVPLKEEFEDLFAATGISATKNEKYLQQVGKTFAKGQWSRVAKLWKEAPKMFLKIMTELERNHSEQADTRKGDGQPTKRRKTQSRLQTLLDLRPRWDSFARNLEQFEIQISGGSGHFAFSFVEGNLVKAVRNGDWVLLDEINLATPDTLESIADLLSGPSERPSILLSETGEIEKIVAHPDFRIFGAMNPATDIGKRDLPVGIRSRFTELYVRSPDADLKDLLVIIKAYLGNSSTKNDQAADDIARLYLNTKRMAAEKRLVDGANEVPHFSLRTLTRVLSYVNTIAPLYGVRRALYEGFSMGFLTLLDRDSEKLLVPLIYHHLLDRHGNPQSLLSQVPKHPDDGKQYVRFRNKDRDRQYWLFQGEQPPVERDDYIITPYVERNLLNLVRATSTRRFPILIQGPTSAGKTSMIEYLANFTGNKFVRINNHEHTDLQEYLGTYVSGTDGKLRFQEGILVQAMRQGHWIVLDELNLAPTDVLEALNRLLDDNRELLIPETQEVVKPHENFILFATQNPAGLYGGRKALSRAFRNRFLELHFDDIPEDELEFILQQRSRNTSPPDCRRIVTVYKELSRLRQGSRLFEQKDSFATLRDLFRWALREAETREEIAAHGFMLLAERVRDEEERIAVKEIIERVFKVKIDPQQLYSADFAPELKAFTRRSNSQGVVWTHAMRRLYVLVSRSLRNNEPVLLVGETGCGKTTVCQLLAEAIGVELHIVNAHQNMETGDLIGSQRPVRNRGAILEALNIDLKTALNTLGLTASSSVEQRLEQYQSLDAAALDNIPQALREKITTGVTRSKALFEWADGALVEAMRNGQLFLLDEISLADDSVLERLNSVLEPQRTLLLAEKGIDNSFVVASSGFQFFATMNPGGDFGKKELSPALRNRFTEIWVPPLSESEDIYEIVKAKLDDGSKHLVEVIVQFATWFAETFRSTASTKFSIREMLAWVQFMNGFQSDDPIISLVHGASTIFIDSIGANPSAMLATDPKSIHQQRQNCLQSLGQLVGHDVSAIYQTHPEISLTDHSLRVGEFTIARTPGGSTDSSFAFDAPTTRLNTMRVLRALQMNKPILLEGSPGVGKTTLVAALSRACGQPLTRINLSDQTDLMDLFGTDVPVEGQEAGNFAWRDAPFLQAMQKGEWVLLDEMNLASQSVLEGLNACLDHRGEVYISELDQVFKRHPDFRLFAAQNPHHQGGGRKGLPSSFVNRFIVVYADVFTDDDLSLIATHSFPDVSLDVIKKLVHFMAEIDRELVVEKSFGSQGGPWEFNLRDVLRWLHLLDSPDPLLQTGEADDFLNILVKQRFRTTKDRAEVDRLFSIAFGAQREPRSLYHDVNARFAQIGIALLSRNLNSQPERLPSIDTTPRLAELESVMICVRQNIPCILSSPSGYGKSVLLEHVAALAGKPLVVFPMNADIDTMDLVGGFEQADPLREVNAALRSLADDLQESIMSVVPNEAPPQALKLLHLLTEYSGDSDSIPAIRTSIESLLARISEDSNVAATLAEALRLLQRPLVLANPRFEWLDGVIVKALQTGQWLVLDNANMCNASVLDRLNSLLEPNGFLSINEHCGPGGEPRMVKPHPDFRIFLTMDPRYGELSRAMRNRAVEIYLHTPPPTTDTTMKGISDIESRLVRYQTACEFSSNISEEDISVRVTQVALDHLSLQDNSLLQRFVSDAAGLLCDSPNFSHSTQDLLGFLQSDPGSSYFENVARLYSDLPGDYSLSVAQAQPLHSLNNSSMSQLLPNVDGAIWYAVYYETSRQLYRLYEVIESQRRQAQTAKLASLTRFQRSLISERVAAVAKDSTVKLAKFCAAVMDAMLQHLRANAARFDAWKDQLSVLRHLGQYIERTIRIASATSFDEAKFQAHLVQGASHFQDKMRTLNDITERQFLASVLEQLDQNFTLGFKLSTGLSMELMWNKLRPTPIPHKAILDSSVELGLLGVRFDTLRWKANSSISDLSKALGTLQQAYKIVRDGAVTADDLVKELTSAIGSLEARIGLEAPDLEPFLAPEFDDLRQIATLRHAATGESSEQHNLELMVLSNTPTRAALMLATSEGPAALLQAVDYLTYQEHASWNGKFTVSLWSKLQSMDAVSLNSLALLETELPAIGRQISDLTVDIVEDPLSRLNPLLLRLTTSVFAAHGPEFEHALTEGYELAQKHANAAPDAFERLFPLVQGSHLEQLAEDYFVPAMCFLANSENSIPKSAYLSAQAWIRFSIGAIKLFVPDRVFDPQLRPMMEREFFEELQRLLEDDITALQAFESKFTGQSTNARIQLLEREIRKMGPLPDEVRPVYRPEASELSQLHAEFSNILKAIDAPALLSALQVQKNEPQQDSEGLRFVKENVSRMIDRLSARFEAYQDMTRPTVNLLRCLAVGLSLYDASLATDQAASTEFLLEATPFFGGPYWMAEGGDLPVKDFEFLNLMSTIVSVEGLDSLDLRARESIFECFHGLYDEWNKKLHADRKAEETKSSLYQFRGSYEDEEEFDAQEFDELFPTYNDEDSGKPLAKSNDQVRNISVKAAEAHRKIFLESQDMSAAIRDLCASVGNRISNETKDQFYVNRDLNRKMLPNTLLLLNDKIEGLNSASSAGSYNFYTDSNLPEVRKLVSLTNDVKIRFRELQLVDEIGHMQNLTDVLQSCNTLLELVHTEPLAKILPKVEQLHAHVYEWEFGGWASKAYSVLSIHNSLTDTIIRWRRLELSTWANLFDTEQKKCQDDAYSWWFVAYQVVVAVPLTMVDSASELQLYASSLIQDLELYFSTSIVGQFSARIGLLRQLRNHLKLLVKEYPLIEIIYNALASFVDYYARYEKLAADVIQKGRVPIEKNMKDVLLMASWKDTNINALRESARKSHMKLFRIVRKWRSVLGHEMKTVIDQGLPDEDINGPMHKQVQAISGEVSNSATVRLNESLPGWLGKHRRLANVSKTISVMKNVVDGANLSTHVPQAIDDFVSSLNTSMAELRKETPSSLTDENKTQVKHLKTRKRKLFAETLRELRNMGFKFNLGQDRLSEQESLAKVLALGAPFDFEDSASVNTSNYCFHKVLDLAPKARAAVNDHSEDLTGAEVARSVGFVEGMIHFLLSQRKGLAHATESFALLQRSTSVFRELGDVQATGGIAHSKDEIDFARLLPWLVQILRLGTRLVQVHGKLGGAEHDRIIAELKTWTTKYESHLDAFNGLARLPENFTSPTRLELERQISEDLDEIDQSLENIWCYDNPQLKSILNGIRAWTRLTIADIQPESPTSDLETFCRTVSTLCDTILVAVESANKAGKSIPREEDEAGWLTKHNDGFSSMIAHLHMNDVDKCITQCIDTLKRVDLKLPGVSDAASGVIALASPIVDQFLATCEQCIGQGVEIHRAAAHMAFSLTRTFTQLSSQGFCTPQEKSDEKSGEGGQLESGTGLGEGEGADDISKDIQPDEDLSELAQEANKEENGEIEDEKDAVDMADEEMEGDMGSVDGAEDDEEGSKKDDQEDDENELDEEAGEVDDLDPTAVDEKMWDGDDEKAEKDQQGDKAQGQKKDDEQIAADDDSKQNEAEEQPEVDEAAEQDTEEAGAEPEEVQAQEEMNRQDQNVQENETLALPEDMEMDFDDHESASSDDAEMNELSDVEDDKKEGEEDLPASEDEEMEQPVGKGKDEDEAGEEEEANEPETDEQATGKDEVQDEVEPETEETDEQQPQEQMDQAPPQQDDAAADTENAAPSDVKSSGQDQNADSMDLDEQLQNSAAQQEDGEMGEGAANQDTSSGAKGEMSRSNEPPVDKPEEDTDAKDSARSDPFKKLGDALEKWHRQQSDIKTNAEDDIQQKAPQTSEAEQSRQEFQHLQNDDEADDTQAMGKADEDQVQPIDESMAIDEERQDPNSRLIDEEDDEMQEPAADQADQSEKTEAHDMDKDEKDDGRSGVKTRQGDYNREPSPTEQETQIVENENDVEEIEETSTQLSTTHISDEQRSLRDLGECTQQWAEFQSKTNALSLSLTSQLRLILTPSQSTKLSGGFRTGKRLNIKRIIPYIASSYKRDKIWMRRSIPTKRTYQILLCVDDSKSMGESSSGKLAMESLVMVSRSLTMLEAGQIGVLGFGSDVVTAHPLTDPFASDAGAKVLQNFTFRQDRTDVALLIRQTIDTFRTARQQSSGNSDLWQLALILSDGLTPSSAHDSIRRLLREAIEERIMVVFIIIDDTDKKKGDSVLELKEAKFVNEGGESTVVIERYLDTFPFQYYLIVHDLEELPSALSGLLRTWFAEVAS